MFGTIELWMRKMYATDISLYDISAAHFTMVGKTAGKCSNICNFYVKRLPLFRESVRDFSNV
jgi:hypothetical protein